MNPELEEMKSQVNSEVEKVTRKIGEIGSLVTEFQKKNDENLKKYDAVNEDQLKKLGEAIATVSEIKQKQELVELSIKRFAAEGDKEDKNGVSAEQKAYNEALVGPGGYIRKGVEEKALSVISDPDGGYLVTPAMSNRISTRIFETSPIRALATVETITTDSLDIIIDDDEPTASWVGETATRSETNTPAIAKKSIPVHELQAMPKATQKILDDAGINIEQWLANKVADKFARSEATAFISGDGILKPKGILDYAAWASAGVYERNKIEQLNSGSNGDFDGDDLIDLQGILKEVYRPRASWLMKRSVFTKILKMKTSNEYIFNNFNTIQGSGFNLLGSTVYFADDMPVAATNSLSVAYGDIGAAYTVVDRVGIRILRDPFTSKPYTLFYTTKRVGGDVVNFEAIKLLKLST